MYPSSFPFDKLIETMFALNGNIPLLQHHFERLTRSFPLLQIPASVLPQKNIQNKILETALHANLDTPTKIRLAISINKQPITTFEITSEKISALPESIAVNIYQQTDNITNPYAQIKSNDRALFYKLITARENTRFHETIIVNAAGIVSQASISNVFILKNRKWITPPLTDECVAGVMRNFLLLNATALNFPCSEQSFTHADLLNADAIILTNAVRGLMPVHLLENRFISTALSMPLAKQINTKIFGA